MKIWLIQTHLSPYRIELFQRIAETEGVEFELVLLSDRFKVRPQWKRDLTTLPFPVFVPRGFSFRVGAEHEFCVNPFFLFDCLRKRPDVIICGGFSLATVTAWCYRLLRGKPYVIWTEATHRTDGRMSPVRKAMRRVLCRGCGAFLEAGTQARDYVRELLPKVRDEQLFRTYNCVNHERFRFEEPRADEANRLREKDSPEKNFLFVGKLNQRKGVPQLLEAYRILVEQSEEEAGLILIGEGPERERVERFRSEHGARNVRMKGWLENDEAARFYKQTDCFILLSRIDHNPLVLFEALAAGLPIICSNGACNAGDFIEEGQNGFIVDPADAREVARRMREVLSWDEAKRAHCREVSSRAVAKANYEDAARAFVEAARFASGSGFTPPSPQENPAAKELAPRASA